MAKLEVEGKEILIKSSKGMMAVIPKEKVSWVQDQIDSGKHELVDKYVNSLTEFKHDEQKAANGLYANIHAKRARIAAGSGERMRSPGEAGAPTAGQFKQAAKTAKAEDGVKIVPQPSDWEKFKQFNATLPSNLRDDNFQYGDKNKYDLYGMWEASNRPGSFTEVKDTEFFPLQGDGTYHGFSVGNEGVWLKPKSHPTAWMEYNSTQLNPKMQDMRVIQREDGKLQYVPKTPFLDVVASYKKSMASPTYKQRLARELYGDAPPNMSEVDKNYQKRVGLLDSLKIEKTNTNDVGEYFPDKHSITYNPEKAKEYGSEESVLAHETGHALDTELMDAFTGKISPFTKKKVEISGDAGKDYYRDIEGKSNKLEWEGLTKVVDQIEKDVKDGKLKVLDQKAYNEALKNRNLRNTLGSDSIIGDLLKSTNFDNDYYNELEKSTGNKKLIEAEVLGGKLNFMNYLERDTEVKAKINALRIKANLNHGYNFDEPFDIRKYPTLKGDINYKQLSDELKIPDDAINKLSEYVAYEPNKTEKQTAKNGMMIAPISALNSKIKSRQKAAEGMLITPPVKRTTVPSTTQVRMPVKPKLNIGGQVSKPQPTTPGLTDLIKKTWNRYSNNGNDRTFLDVASNFIPKYEQFVDYKDMATGAATLDKEKLNSGVLGLAAPIAGKAALSGMDYFTEKMLGKKEADNMAQKRKDLVNMSENELVGLFKKYGRGGYDKWVKEGKPSLTK